MNIANPLIRFTVLPLIAVLSLLSPVNAQVSQLKDTTNSNQPATDPKESQQPCSHYPK